VSKQTEIKAGILRIHQICETGINCPDGDDPCAECRTNQIIDYLDSEGVRIVVEGELPKFFMCSPQDMLEAGYKLTESIKEETNGSKKN